MKKIALIIVFYLSIAISCFAQYDIVKRDVTVLDDLILKDTAKFHLGDSIVDTIYSGTLVNDIYVDNAINNIELSDQVTDTTIHLLDLQEGNQFDVDIAPSSSKSTVNLYDPDLDSEILIDSHFIRFNESERIFEFSTGSPDVIWQGPTEDLIFVYNNSGSTLLNGKPLYYSGTNGDSIATVGLATNMDLYKANRFVGIATEDIPNNSAGFMNVRGYTRNFNTSLLDQDSVIYLGDGELIDTVPAYPDKVIVAGVVIKSHATEGIIYTYINRSFNYQLLEKDYSFTSQGIAAGTWYVAGIYNYASADANLTQAGASITYGSANIAYCSHASVICGGPGTVNTGVVGLRVTGTSINDAGVLTTSDADTIITDITAVALNEYYEAKKFVGITTYELITMSGSPTTYSFDFNYGYSKYEDFGNRDFYLAELEIVGLAAASDASFNIELLHHKSTGWTYAATGFIPGDGAIISMYDDLNPYDDLLNGKKFAYKRTNVNQFVNGADSEGVIIRVTTSANNAVQFMNMHLVAATQQ